ncbi:Uncharacterised protein [Salmonella enterica subsp. arizonae]|nr:Uncharacterised protein [Salmonella enterica subsp. arizonae]
MFVVGICGFILLVVRYLSGRPGWCGLEINVISVCILLFQYPGIFVPHEKSPHSLSPEQTVADQAHLTWCALMALQQERHEGQELSPLTTHIFLLRRPVTAQKQRRFPRFMVTDTGNQRRHEPLLRPELIFTVTFRNILCICDYARNPDNRYLAYYIARNGNAI